jgi:hypothetical protein
VVPVRDRRFFRSMAFANVSSFGLKSEKMLREATKIILHFALLTATVRRRGSRRKALEARR